MSELLTKYHTLSPETRQQVDDFVDFLLAKDQSHEHFDMKAWKEKIKSVSVWSEEDVQELENNRKLFNEWKGPEW